MGISRGESENGLSASLLITYKHFFALTPRYRETKKIRSTRESTENQDNNDEDNKGKCKA